VTPASAVTIVALTKAGRSCRRPKLSAEGTLIGAKENRRARSGGPGEGREMSVVASADEVQVEAKAVHMGLF